jgi:hypothetical protein
MEFSFNENQAMIAQMVRDFGEKEIRPHFPPRNPGVPRSTTNAVP